MTETWAETTARTVTQELKRLRKDVLGMSVARLADRTRDIGHPISVNTITDLELGRRSRMDVTELLVLARALEVPPATLLFPGLPDRETEALPGWTTSASRAVEWLAGESAPAQTFGDTPGQLSAGMLLPDLARRLNLARVEELDARTAAHDLPEDATAEDIEKAARWLRHTAELVETLRWQIEELGGETSSDWLRRRGHS